MRGLEKLKRHLRPGQVYRRKDLAQFSTNVDRHLRQLVDAGELEKIRTGMYHRPRKSLFLGDLPPKGHKVVKAFLKDDNFMMVSLSAYNDLRLGTTQLYNIMLVYNHKRDGRIKLDGRNYYFFKNRKFPKKVTEEFRLVDLMNNLNMLAEDHRKLTERVGNRAYTLGIDKVRRAANAYGKVATKKFFENLIEERAPTHAR